MFPYKLTEKGKEQYEVYLREHLAETGKHLVSKRDTVRLNWFLEHYLEEKRQAEELLEISGKLHTAECTACLMDWKKRKFGDTASAGIPDFDF